MSVLKFKLVKEVKLVKKLVNEVKLVKKLVKEVKLVKKLVKEVKLVKKLVKLVKTEVRKPAEATATRATRQKITALEFMTNKQK